jgi:hypothetical protein
MSDEAWRERRRLIGDRNAAASERGKDERKVSLSRVSEERRLNAQREKATTRAKNARLTRARPRG